MTLWHLSTIATAIGAAQPAKDLAITGIHFDSRAVQPGDLFLAMPGGKTDGHAFIADAVQRGAVAAVVKEVNPSVAIPQLVVPDVQAALKALGQAACARYAGPIVGVGGGVGKTTTIAFLAALLQAHAPIGSLNNHVGVPLTLARLPEHAPAFVAEIGTNKLGEIAPLAKQVRPHVALITNVVEEHLEGLGNLENVRLEELSIVQGLAPDGILVVPEDLEIAGCGWGGTVQRFNPAATLPTDVTLIEPTPARIACANAALAVVKALTITPDAAAIARLAAVAPPAGRGQVQIIGDITLIDDSYNANPASVAAALLALKQRPVKRRIVVLGDMRELGTEEIRYHTELAPQLAGIDGVILLGPLMQHLIAILPPAQVWGAYANPDDFDPASLLPHVQAGDVILVKGSKSITYVRKVAQRVAQALQSVPK